MHLKNKAKQNVDRITASVKGFRISRFFACVPLQRSFYNLEFVVSVPSVCGLLQHFCVTRRVFLTVMTATICHFTYEDRGKNHFLGCPYHNQDWQQFRLSAVRPCQCDGHTKIHNYHLTTIITKIINHPNCIQTISILLLQVTYIYPVA